jgi:hypothetical protein
VAHIHRQIQQLKERIATCSRVEDTDPETAEYNRRQAEKEIAKLRPMLLDLRLRRDEEMLPPRQRLER